MNNLDRLEAIVARLPEVERVDVEAWGDEPTFRVSGKVFVFAAGTGGGISVKLPVEGAAAVVASDAAVEPMGYGLGRHGWVSLTIPEDAGGARPFCAPGARSWLGEP